MNRGVRFNIWKVLKYAINKRRGIPFGESKANLLPDRLSAPLIIIIRYEVKNKEAEEDIIRDGTESMKISNNHLGVPWRATNII